MMPVKDMPRFLKGVPQWFYNTIESYSEPWALVKDQLFANLFTVAIAIAAVYLQELVEILPGNYIETVMLQALENSFNVNLVFAVSSAEFPIIFWRIQLKEDTCTTHWMGWVALITAAIWICYILICAFPSSFASSAIKSIVCFFVICTVADYAFLMRSLKKNTVEQPDVGYKGRPDD